MAFRITGLSAAPFRHLFGLSDGELAARGVRRYHVDRKPGFPDRIELRDADPGETVLLLNHACLAADTPYRATHAIFVREGASRTCEVVDDVPEAMRIRLLSLRSYDDTDMMLDADVVEGVAVEALIERLFADPAARYIHVHHARRGCYACRIDRSP